MRMRLWVAPILLAACHGQHQAPSGTASAAVNRSSASAPVASAVGLEPGSLPAGEPNVCRYFSDDEARALAGVSLKPGVPRRHTCAWYSADSANTTLLLLVNDHGGAEQFAHQLKLFPRHEDVPGLGEQ